MIIYRIASGHSDRCLFGNASDRMDAFNLYNLEWCELYRINFTCACVLLPPNIPHIHENYNPRKRERKRLSNDIHHTTDNNNDILCIDSGNPNDRRYISSSPVRAPKRLDVGGNTKTDDDNTGGSGKQLSRRKGSNRLAPPRNRIRNRNNSNSNSKIINNSNGNKRWRKEMSSNLALENEHDLSDLNDLDEENSSSNSSGGGSRSSDFHIKTHTFDSEASSASVSTQFMVVRVMQKQILLKWHIMALIVN